MSILQYFQRQNHQNDNVSLPDQSGSLSRNMASAAIVAANAKVRLLMAEVEAGQSLACRHRPVYNTYTPKQRSTIGKYAVEYGVMVAKRKFSRKLQVDINESSLPLSNMRVFTRASSSLFSGPDAFLKHSNW